MFKDMHNFSNSQNFIFCPVTGGAIPVADAEPFFDRLFEAMNESKAWDAFGDGDRRRDSKDAGRTEPGAASDIAMVPVDLGFGPIDEMGVALDGEVIQSNVFKHCTVSYARFPGYSAICYSHVSVNQFAGNNGAVDDPASDVRVQHARIFYYRIRHDRPDDAGPDYF